jgi:hypothetical protein
MDDRPNPFAAPQTDISPVTIADEATPDAERIRRQYLNHETSIKSIGVLFYLNTIGSIITAILWFERGSVIIASLLAVQAPLLALTGYYLRKLQPWSRIPTGIFAVLALIYFPIGTMVGGYILWLVFGRKGQKVFSPEYARVIAQTPHIRYRTSKIVIFFALLLAAVVLLGLFSFVFVRPVGR